jgi:hypothetical protein
MLSFHLCFSPLKTSARKVFHTYILQPRTLEAFFNIGSSAKLGLCACKPFPDALTQYLPINHKPTAVDIFSLFHLPLSQDRVLIFKES